MARTEEKIANRVKLFRSDLYDKCNKKEFAAAKKEHDKLFEVPKLRTQLKTLKYLISAA